MIIHALWTFQEWRRRRARQREEYMAFIGGSPPSQRWFNRRVRERTFEVARRVTW